MRPAAMAFVLLAVLASACTGPARTDASYDGKARSTAEDVRSAVSTALILIEATDRHHLSAAYVSTTAADLESDAVGAEASFSSIQPPSGRSDRTRTETLDVVGDATDTLAAVRIDARRGELSDLVRYEAPLRMISRQLERLIVSASAR